VAICGSRVWLRTCGLALAGVLTSCTLCAGAQAPAGSQPAVASFDVVSVKVAKPGQSGSSSNSRDGSFTATNSTLKSLIQFDAYEIPGPQIFGIPATLENVTFDIEAKIDPDVSAQMKTLGKEESNRQFKQMMQQLLADRFKLAVHMETRQMPIYALTVAKGGAKLQAAKNPEGGTNRTARTGQLKAEGVTMADLAQSLTRILASELGRVAVDQTGLTGKYDLLLKWTPDTGPPPMLNGEPDTSAPNIFTAIQEQLGLKLEAAKGPVTVLVVDHAEMPAEN
jgi:uncharacterized protein (TIGR03435 family)